MVWNALFFHTFFIFCHSIDSFWDLPAVFVNILHIISWLWGVDYIQWFAECQFVYWKVHLYGEFWMHCEVVEQLCICPTTQKVRRPQCTNIWSCWHILQLTEFWELWEIWWNYRDIVLWLHTFTQQVLVLIIFIFLHQNLVSSLSATVVVFCQIKFNHRYLVNMFCAFATHDRHKAHIKMVLFELYRHS